MPKLEKPKAAKAPKSGKDKPPAKAKDGKAKVPDKPPIYPEIELFKAVGEDAVTHEQAKTLVGWQTESDYIAEQMALNPGATADRFKWSEGEYALIDFEKNKVRLLKSTRNRYITRALLDQYAQEHLNRRWRINGETIVIGNYEEVLSGQHRLCSVIIAYQMWKAKTAMYEEKWPTPPTMECLIVYGIDEHDDTVNTLDTGKPRTLPEVLYRSDYFKGLPPGQRKENAQALAYAATVVWERSGMAKDFGHKFKTHGEMMGFIERHPTILETTGHVVSEDSEKKLRICTRGQASGFNYLMAAAATDGDFYRKVGSGLPRSEKDVDFAFKEKAKEFWRKLIQHSSHFDGLWKCIAGMTDPVTGEGAKPDMKLAAIINAWRIFSGRPDNLKPALEEEWYEEHMSVKKIRPDIKRQEAGYMALESMPDLGGIDLGDDSFKKDEEESRKKTEELDEIDKVFDDDEDMELEEVPATDEDLDGEAEREERRAAIRKEKEKGPSKDDDDSEDGPLDKLLKRPMPPKVEPKTPPKKTPPAKTPAAKKPVGRTTK